jgi:hypothetical protein
LKKFVLRPDIPYEHGTKNVYKIIRLCKRRYYLVLSDVARAVIDLKSCLKLRAYKEREEEYFLENSDG